ncbi:MAG: redox-regulated ATPase YchF [Puniceicoccales bacterium]|jgi:GTP-binding protein YchF|nr:redox-regulated ATPase YchF [Puniceicoccales bacterium]
MGMLQAGIVGLPNVGKSTLFNALTRTRKAAAENYPFCTIDPNVGIVEVPDERLAALKPIAKTDKLVPAAIEFVDIAGLVTGAHRGEGLGNKFLAHIREVDIIVHVVRCFEDGDIIHSSGNVDPLCDMEVIHTELILADLQSIENQYQRNIKKARAQDSEAVKAVTLLQRLRDFLNQGHPASALSLNEEEKILLKSFHLLSSKPVIYACNVAENEIARNPPFVERVREYIAERCYGGECCTICAQLESDLVDFSSEDAKAYLTNLGIADSGASHLIRTAYSSLGLASYFTAGEMEVHAWTFKIGMKAPQCAGIIHGDFERGFIKAEVVSYEDLIKAGSLLAAKEAGKYRLEGKDYKVQDGDVMTFRFNS